MDCPQCGTPTREWSDGVCLSCSKDNEYVIAEHHFRWSLWQQMSPRQRELAIKAGVYSG